MHYILYASNMPCDVGMAAFLASVYKGFETIGFTTNEAENTELIASKLVSKPFSPKTILLIGSYWRHYEIIQIFPNCDITLYGLPSVSVTIGIEIIDCSTTTPSSFLEFYIAKFTPHEIGDGLLSFYFTHFSIVLQMIEDRLYNRSILENQIFYTGLYNTGKKDLNNYERFINLFNGTTRMEDIMSKGKVILESQIGLAMERVKNNSVRTKFSDGTEAVITDAPDLVNLTHTQLHERYPDATVTIAASLSFGENHPNEIKYSLRSFNTKKCDLKEVIQNPVNKEFKGGAFSSNSAGGRIKFDFQLPF